MCCPRDTLPAKDCARCSRVITWRKKWSRCWEQVRFCSARCRRQRVLASDTEIEAAILGRLANCAAGATICPSEAARCVSADSWRDFMQATRAAARRLVSRGEIDIVQHGQVVDPSRARGPIRLRRRQSRT